MTKEKQEGRKDLAKIIDHFESLFNLGLDNTYIKDNLRFYKKKYFIETGQIYRGRFSNE